MSLSIIILGCGSSAGVPRVGTGWGACDPTNPKNRRRRCSIVVERASVAGTTTVLVDTSPDLRDQLLTAGVERLDAVLFTHDHADHTHGIDDLRPLVGTMRRRIPVYADEATGSVLAERFRYCFETPTGSDYPPILERRMLRAGSVAVVGGPGGTIEALPFRVVHGSGDALGFRFENIAYVPDVNGIPEASRSYLEGLDILIIDALRYTPHPSHFSVPETLELIERLRPKRSVLTNLHTDLDFAELQSRLPPNVEPAFDEMRIDALDASTRSLMQLHDE